MNDDTGKPKTHLGLDDEIMCADGAHVFKRAASNEPCSCRQERLTADDMAEVLKAPYGLLVAHGLALPVCLN